MFTSKAEWVPWHLNFSPANFILPNDFSKKIFCQRQNPNQIKKIVDINSALAYLPQLETQKATIDNELKALKLGKNYSVITTHIKNTKSQIYNYMVENNLQILGDLTIQKVSPAAAKKAERQAKKAGKFTALLDAELTKDDYDVDEIAGKLAEL